MFNYNRNYTTFLYFNQSLVGLKINNQLIFRPLEILAHRYAWPHGQNVLIPAAELLDCRGIRAIDFLGLNFPEPDSAVNKHSEFHTFIIPSR